MVNYKKLEINKIERKWQKKWQEEKIYEADILGNKPFYLLVELTYTSGDLHMGHWFAWTAPDIFARYKRMMGENVLFPVGGFDAFGLPAENAAIKHGIHPSVWTHKNIETMRRQFETMGPSFDWEREVITSDPEYYRWTQWLFIQLYNKGLAYRGKVWSNWCPECKTVLANEHVENGCCWRHTSTPVEQKLVDQWLFRITDYANKLIWSQNPKVDWPQAAVEGQNNWIGRSEGILIDWEVIGKERKITTFTTRPDTIFGVTFLVLSPEHQLVSEIASGMEVMNYLSNALVKTERERKEGEAQKTGVFTGYYAENPLSKERIPIWISDFVLGSYGTGAIMGVPAHDQRDFEFAKKYSLEIKPVILPEREYVDNNAQSYYQKRSKLHKKLLTNLANEAKKANKKMMVMGGWAVYLQVGEEFRDFEDLDLIILNKDLEWWRKLLNSYNLELQNLYPETKDNKYYFQAVGKDTHVDVGAIKIDTKGNVVWLDEKTDKKSDKFENIFEKKSIESALVYTMKQDFIYDLKMQKEKETRWKEKADFLFMRLEPYVEDGVLINSGEYSGLKSQTAGTKISNYIVSNHLGEKSVQYHLRDWSVSRQRYWGAPVPIIYCQQCWQKSKIQNPKSKLREGVDYAVLEDKEYMIHPVPEADLPVTLPENVDYTPTGKPPLATAEGWVKVACPECGGAALRDVETLDTYVDSSWYFFRYLSPKNDKAPFDEKVVNKWMPIKVYFGGPEHILGHTLYARFITKFLYDIGYIKFDEFALKRFHHGVILGPDGYRMSKSRGNVVNPDEQVAKFGADSVRVYIAFLGPHDKGGAWKTEGIEGSNRFLNRVWRLITDYPNVYINEGDAKSLYSKMHKTIQKVSKDIELLQTNTALSAIMEYVNLLYEIANKNQKLKNNKINSQLPISGREIKCAEWDEALKTLGLLLAPFAPHITEEIWVNVLGEKFSVHKSTWPKFNPELVKEDFVTIVIQVNGKVRGTLLLGSEQANDKNEVIKVAKEDQKIQKWLTESKVKDTIFVPGKLVNFVV